MIGAPVTFTGMLVDAEPYGSYSSQLFFDKMSFRYRWRLSDRAATY